MKRLRRIAENPDHIAYQIASIAAIVIFSIVMLVVCIQSKPVVIGECDDYMLSTVALQNHFTLEIKEEDVARAIVDFPEYSAHLQHSWDNRSFALFNTSDGKVYPNYFGTYSAACIPAKVALHLMGASQSRAFPLTNIASWIAALLVAFFFLKRSRRAVLITLLLLMCVPVFPYYFWPSAEMFLYALMVCSVVFLVNRQFGQAVLFNAVAATLNATALAFGIFIIALYFYDCAEKYRGKNNKFSMKGFVRTNIKGTLWLALCYTPILLVLAFNAAIYGGFVPQVVNGQGVSDGWLARFAAYFFDLNIGFVVYVPVLLVVLGVGIIISVIRKKYFELIFAIGFLFLVFAYSRMEHINSGATGISRYSAWALPTLVMYAAVLFPGLIDTYRFKRAAAALLAVSCVVSAVAVTTLSLSYSHKEFSPIAKYVMNTLPELYRPLPDIFLPRALGEEPFPPEAMNGVVAYSDDEGNVRQLFVAQDYYTSFDQIVAAGEITGSREDLDYLLARVEELKQSTGPYEYIDLPSTVHLMMAGPVFAT